MTKKKIAQLREELHRLAEQLDYDFSKKEIIDKSVELDKALNEFARVDINLEKCHYK